MTVVRTRPSVTKAHSAAVACQCSSRITPGSMRIDTPAMPFEIGSWADGGLFAVAASHHASLGFFQLELEGWKLLSGGYGIGNVVLEADMAAFGTDRN